MGVSMSVVVGMSGGIDSAAAAALLVDLGEKVTGVTLHFSSISACCDVDSVTRAKAQCRFLGIPWHEVDLQEVFRMRVIEPFWRGVREGLTPNPCVYCNEMVKWEGLLGVARELSADFIATGHYAGIVRSVDGDQICRGKDSAKDQSYFLYRLTAEQRRRATFPLAGRTKDQVRDFASQRFAPDLLASRQSQDLCFVRGSVSDAAKQELPPKPGNIVLADGAIVGRHNGLHAYTIGQRSGLAVSSSHRLYVLGKRIEQNQLVVGFRDECLRDKLEAADLRWQHVPTEASASFTADVVARFRTKPVRGKIERISRDRVVVCLNEPIFGVTPGQAVVYYDTDRILGGGTIV